MSNLMLNIDKFLEYLECELMTFSLFLKLHVYLKNSQYYYKIHHIGNIFLTYQLYCCKV